MRASPTSSAAGWKPGWAGRRRSAATGPVVPPGFCAAAQNPGGTTGPVAADRRRPAQPGFHPAADDVGEARIVGEELVAAGSCREQVAAAGPAVQGVVARVPEQLIGAALPGPQGVGPGTAVESVVAGTAVQLDEGPGGER